MLREVLKYSIFITCLLLAFVVTAVFGDNKPQRSSKIENYQLENQTPVVESVVDSMLVGVVDSAANYIVDSAGVLKPVMERLLALRSGGQDVVSILHIGDSHIQAGYLTARSRELFQAEFGDAGRGLITPHKLVGGNEPPNYAITTNQKFDSAKATSKDNGGYESLTGSVVSFWGAKPELTIWSKSKFDAVTVLHANKAPLLADTTLMDFDSYCVAQNTKRSTRLVLKESVDTLKLSGVVSEEFDDPTYFGFVLESGEPGVLYHELGVNSAAFEHIEKNTSITTGGAEMLYPDLIIISLGTNNCYGRGYRTKHFYNVAERFVQKVAKEYPEAVLLITTPMESCKRQRGARVPNENIADVAKVLKEVAVANGVAYWDMYAATGGRGSNAKWASKGLFSRDRIHLTQSGYTLQGELFYQAFARYYNNYIRYGSGEPRAEELSDSLSMESMSVGNECDSLGVSVESGKHKIEQSR